MRYYLQINGKEAGPFELEDLRNQNIGPDTRVFAPGWTDWRNASEVAEIKQLFTAARTTPPTPKPTVTPTPGININDVKAAAAAERQARLRRQSAQQQSTPGPLFGQQMPPANPWGQTPPPQPQPKPAAEKAEWFIDVNGAQVGPLTLSQLMANNIYSGSMVWKEGMEMWHEAKDVAELKSYMQSRPPAPTESTDEYSDYGYATDDATDYSSETGTTATDPDIEESYGHPILLPIIALLISFALAIYNYHNLYQYDNVENSLKGALANNFVWLATSIMALLCGIAAGSNHKKGELGAAVKRSGAATAYAFTALIAIVVAYINHTFGYHFLDPFLS